MPTSSRNNTSEFLLEIHDLFDLHQKPTAELPLGTNLVDVTVIDSSGDTASGSTIVIVRDTTAPVIISASASPNVLWPPNHKMVPVTVVTKATDNCGTPTWKIINVQSNQPVLGGGSGNTAADWQILSENMVALRAERSASSARIYTLTLQAEDASDNRSALMTLTVRVP